MEQLTGRVTADAKVNVTTSGKKVVNFSIAINDRFKSKGGEPKEITRFVNCSYWINEGVATYLKKGQLVEIAGRIDLNVWNDAEGKAKGVLTMQVANIKLHGKNVPAAPTPVTADIQVSNDDLPF